MNNYEEKGDFLKYLRKTMRIMRLSLFLIVISTAMAFSATSYSQNTKLTLDLKNATVKEVIKAIEDQSEFLFFYQEKHVDMDRQVTIHVTDQDVETILDQVFAVTNNIYVINDRQVVIGIAPRKELERQMVNLKGNVKPVIEQPQQKEITGKVTDTDGLPLPGVSIIVKGTTIGTVTNADGEFSLSIPLDAEILQFSFVGMRTQEIPIEGRTTFTVVMEEETIGIEEVVAVGYGTMTKADLSSSVVTTDAQTLNNVNTINVVEGLQGKLAGLNIKQQTGEPGEYTATFNIRGFGNPLIVVDGIVRNDFTKFDPNSIESISVLKDASAAVYGVEAANGVILVQTKKGNKLKKPSIKYSTRVQLDQLTNANTGRTTNAYEFATQMVETAIYLGKEPPYSRETLQKYKDGTYPSTDWEKVTFKDYALGHDHNLSMTGGGDNITFYTTVGYSDNGSFLKSNELKYKKYNVSTSITGYISDNFSATLNVDGILENKFMPRADLVGSWVYWSTTRWLLPNSPIYANNNPDYLQSNGPGISGLALSHSDIGGYQTWQKRTFQGNLSLDYDFEAIDGLSARVMFGYYNNNRFEKIWSKKYEVYNYDPLSEEYRVAGTQNDPSRLSGDYSEYYQTTAVATINYDKTFLDNHNFKFNTNFERRHEKTDNLWARKEFALDVDQFFAGSSENQSVNSSNIYENEIQNLIGRLNYNYANRYLFQAGFNYGGSSKFPKGKRWGFFPFTSVGWRLSEENFVKNNFSFISELKVRASYGQTGDDAASAYQFLTGYTYPRGNYIFNNQVVAGLGFKGMPNPDITWFTATTKNIGIDLNLFEKLLSMTFDVFQRDRSGLLATRSLSLPESVGAALPQENLNSDRVRGVEINIGHAQRLGEFNYGITAIATYNYRQMRYVEKSPSGNSYLDWRNNTQNRTASFRWGYDYIGQFQTFEEIYNSPIQDSRGNLTLSPGDLKYKDVNNDGLIDGMDQVPIARRNDPRVNYSLNIDMAWKNFYMNVFFQGASLFNFEYLGFNRIVNRWGRNSMEIFMDRWHHEDIFDPSSPLVPGRYPQTGAINNVKSNQWPSTFWIPDATYLRLKELRIGYTIEHSFIKRIGIGDINIFASARNLFTWDKMKVNVVDPENSYTIGWSGNNDYPIATSYFLGLDITF